MRFIHASAVAGARTWTAFVVPSQSGPVDVSARLAFPKAAAKHTPPSAVFWLKPLQETPPAPFLPEHHYTLLQKNRMFKPHVLIIPVGSVVQFPNADPFFHNVFSLFEGKRFDLGLYESGTTRFVSFDKPGISFVFCNIHAEMTAIENGTADAKNNLLKNAPHTADQIASDSWNRPYTREAAAFPAKSLHDYKFWPHVSRVDNVFGDRNPVCSCVGMENYS